jgi:hypothetical protein
VQFNFLGEKNTRQTDLFIFSNHIADVYVHWATSFFAPGLCLTVVDIKFAVKQISQF